MCVKSYFRTVRKAFFSSCSIGLAAPVDAFKKLCLYHIRIVTSFYIARLSLFLIYSLSLKTFLCLIKARPSPPLETLAVLELH